MEGINKIRKTKNQVINFNVTSAGQKITISEKIQPHIKRVTGLSLYATDSNAYIGSTLKLSVSKEEIFPDDFFVRWIRDRENVEINNMHYKIDEEGNNSLIEGTYVDGTPGSVFPVGGYKVQLLLTGYQEK